MTQRTKPPNDRPQVPLAPPGRGVERPVPKGKVPGFVR